MEVDLESKVHESQEPMNSDQYAGGKNIESAAESGERMLEDKEAAQIPIDISKADDAFYVRYYSGHQGKYGHEFLGKFGDEDILSGSSNCTNCRIRFACPG